MNYKTFKDIVNDINSMEKDIVQIENANKVIRDLICMGYLNASEMTEHLDIELKSIINDVKSSIKEDKEKIENYLFLNQHLSFEEDKKWLGMNGDTEISTSYSCPHCELEFIQNEHICGTNLVAPEDMEGILFLEKLKCSCCNKEYITQNGV
tara:strand:- start:2488 stop:2943 length:456 start_codon:yes stop_codon:yes gene_type:complete